MTGRVDDRFRNFALALPQAEESSHMGAADFRVGGKIFATLAYVGRGLGTLKLTPEQQSQILSEDSANQFQSAPGGWGRMGMTLVRLDAPDDVLRDSLKLAYENATAKMKRTAVKRTATKRARA